MAKSKEQKRTEAKARRLADLEEYRKTYLHESGELREAKQRSTGSFHSVFGLSPLEHKNYLIECIQRNLSATERSMEKAAQDAGVDLNGNQL